MIHVFGRNEKGGQSVERESTMKMTVRNIRKDGEKFYFDLVKIFVNGDYEHDVEGKSEIVMKRMTNQVGDGLFEADNFYKQYIGTCDFSLHGKSIEAARLYIKRRLCYDEVTFFEKEN